MLYMQKELAILTQHYKVTADFLATAYLWRLKNTGYIQILQQITVIGDNFTCTCIYMYASISPAVLMADAQVKIF